MRLNYFPVRKYGDRFDEPEENEIRLRMYGSPGEFTVNNILAYLINIVFIGFCIYALVQVNKEDEYHFKSKCGSEGERFYQWMIARVALSFTEIFLIALLSTFMSTMFQNPVVGLISMLSFQVVAHIVYLSISVVFTQQVMNNAECKKAMSAASFTNDPLLGILGWVFVAIDSFIIFLILVFGCISGVIFGNYSY